MQPVVKRKHSADCLLGLEKENGLTQTKKLKLQEAQEQMRAVGERSLAYACLQRHGKPVEDEHNA